MGCRSPVVHYARPRGESLLGAQLRSWMKGLQSAWRSQLPGRVNLLHLKYLAIDPPVAARAWKRSCSGKRGGRVIAQATGQDG